MAARLQRFALLPLLLAALALAGCGGDEGTPEARITGATMGTTYSVRIVDPPDELAIDEITRRIQLALEDVNRRMSTWRDDSEVSLFNAAPPGEWFPVSEDTAALVAMARAVSRMSSGAFDITVGPVVDLWGFGPDPVRVTPPEEAEIAAALARVGDGALESREEPPALRKTSADVAVDLSGIAKGHAVDRVAAVLEQAAIDNYLIEVGGELRVAGHNRRGERWTVAVEDPLAAGREVHRVLNVTDTAIATSGDYRNFFEYEGERYSHTIDPRTGWPVSHDLVSVTVLDESAALADALATALLVLGPEAGGEMAERSGIAAYFVVHSGDGVMARWTSAFAEREVM
ncbi:FAD:protein FMN transferase [Lentisalinibacter salinarum]|uniref:FAD:protein FMN transferase n=1 Tax=Lentisalinibacter salinarum TaxID=2992239 RepID=UPI003867E489